MPNGRREVTERIDFPSFDFSNVTPQPNAFIKWKSRQKWRRAGTRGIGRLVSVEPDGWFRIRYSYGMPGDFKSRTIRVHPDYVVDYREDK